MSVLPPANTMLDKSRFLNFSSHLMTDSQTRSCRPAHFFLIKFGWNISSGAVYASSPTTTIFPSGSRKTRIKMEFIQLNLLVSSFFWQTYILLTDFWYPYLALHRLKRPLLLLLGWHDRRTYKTFLLLLELYPFYWLHKIGFFHYPSQTYPLSLLSSIIKRCRQENYIFRWKVVPTTGLQKNHGKDFLKGNFQFNLIAL